MRLACALLLTVSVWAQTPQGASGPPRVAAKGTIAGRVVNAATGEPLRKAAVVLARVDGPSQPQSTITDEQGQFWFRPVESGRYRLIANRTGFVRQAYGQRDPGSYTDSGGLLSVAAGQEVKDILFRLVPAGAISGRVVDPDGEPIMEVQVQALRWNYSRGRRMMMPAGSERTNDRGEYRIFNLPPGRYYLAATYEGGFVAGYLAGVGGSESEVPLDESYAPVFYPGTSDITQAAPLEVRGDELGGMNLMLAPQRALKVSGRVLNSITGQPGRGVHVAVMARSGTVRAFVSGDLDATTDEQGYFQIRGVLPGSYVIAAEWDGEGQGAGTIITSSVGGDRSVQYNRRHYSARQPLEVGGADVEGVSLVIAPGTDIAGTVHVEGVLPKPAPDIERTTQAGGRTIRFSRTSQMRVVLEPILDLNIGNLSAAIGPDNNFVVSNAPDDTYRINVGGMPEGAYLKSARFGGQDVLEDGLVLTRGRRGSLELVISTNAGSLAGTAVDSNHKPFAGARVALVPEGSARKRPNLFRAATADEYGRFNFRGLAPGDYKVFAWENLEPGAHLDPEFLRPFEDRGQPVHVSEGAQNTAEVQVIPSGQ